MGKVLDRIEQCVQAVREKTDFVPQAALVLGSGLGGFADRIQVSAQVSYRDIPGFPVSTVPGHAGRFLFGYVGKTPVAVMQGRVHYYEGYSVQETAQLTRVPAGTVKSRLSKARSLLRAGLIDSDDGGNYETV